MLSESPTAFPTTTPTTVTSLVTITQSVRQPLGSDNSEGDTSKIIGGIIGGVTALLLAASGVFFLRRNRRKTASTKDNEPKHEIGDQTTHELNGRSRAVEAAGRSDLELHSQPPDARPIHLPPTGPVATDRPLTELGYGSLSTGSAAMSPISELEAGEELR